MKNWIVALVILTLPLAVYWGLKNNQEAKKSFSAHAVEMPSVIKFSSPMCMDCKKLADELEEIKPNYQDKINFIEIDATSNNKNTQEQIEKYGVTVVPTLIFIDTKNQKERKVEGFEKKEHLERYLKELING